MGIHTEKLRRKIAQWKGEDASRASELGEQRAEIREFLDLTGWNKSALAFVRKLDKLDEDKRDDILRSLDDLLNEMRPVWDGNSTPDMLGHNSKPETQPDPVDFAAPEAADYHQDAPADDAEMGDFNAAVDRVSDDAGNVVRPFGAGKSA